MQGFLHISGAVLSYHHRPVRMCSKRSKSVSYDSNYSFSRCVVEFFQRYQLKSDGNIRGRRCTMINRSRKGSGSGFGQSASGVPTQYPFGGSSASSAIRQPTSPYQGGVSDHNHVRGIDLITSIGSVSEHLPIETRHHWYLRATSRGPDSTGMENPLSHHPIEVTIVFQ